MSDIDNAQTHIPNIVKLLFAKAAMKKESQGEEDYSKYNDPYLKAQDEQFLGVITIDRQIEDGIFNPFGLYGSKYSDLSIFNESGTYGSEDSIYSPFNELAQYPPEIIHKGEIIGLLTINDKLPNSVDPEELFEIVKSTDEPEWNLIFERLLNPADDKSD